ncbi:MAG: flagellar biosynthetic protein FliO [bacterium]|jgi:flagellar biogenesis protein FliO
MNRSVAGNLIKLIISTTILASITLFSFPVFNNCQHFSCGISFAQDAGQAEQAKKGGPSEAGKSAASDAGKTGEPMFRDDFVPEDLPESGIDRYNPWGAFAGVLFVLGLLFLGAHFIKKIYKIDTFSAARQLKVIESVSVGTGKQVVLIKAGKFALVVGVTQGAISLLDKMTLDELGRSQASDLDEGRLLEAPPAPGAASFQEKLRQLRQRINGDDEN